MPLTCEKVISQSNAASQSQRFLAILCRMGSLPLPELRILKATILSHQIVTLLCEIKDENVQIATRILIASQ
jgi:hypothetical protein